MCWVCKLYGIRGFADDAHNGEVFQALLDKVKQTRNTDDAGAYDALCQASALPQSRAVH